jgi:hypothetical protein
MPEEPDNFEYLRTFARDSREAARFLYYQMGRCVELAGVLQDVGVRPPEDLEIPFLKAWRGLPHAEQEILRAAEEPERAFDLMVAFARDFVRIQDAVTRLANGMFT